jgi:uncharacterized damage-inducible protein DinB
MGETAETQAGVQGIGRTEPLLARDLLAGQFELVYDVVEQNVRGVTHEGSLAAAAGGGNTANWILAHVITVQNATMQLIGAPPVWQSPELERARYDRPIRDASEAIDWDILVERFNASREACVSAIAALNDEALAEQIIDPFGQPSSRADLLAALLIHQSYHAGQLGMARRAAGLKAAILAPGQTAPI